MIPYHSQNTMQQTLLRWYPAPSLGTLEPAGEAPLPQEPSAVGPPGSRAWVLDQKYICSENKIFGRVRVIKHVISENKILGRVSYQACYASRCNCVSPLSNLVASKLNFLQLFTLFTIFIQFFKILLQFLQFLSNLVASNLQFRNSLLNLRATSIFYNSYQIWRRHNSLINLRAEQQKLEPFTCISK